MTGIYLDESKYEVVESKEDFEKWKVQHKYILRRFNISKNDKVLDVGCSYGHNLSMFGKDSVGVETNPLMVDFSRSKGLKVYDINVEDELCNIDEKFKIIWCGDVLIHLLSPYKFLYDCRNLLEEDGKLMIQIPVANWNFHHSTCHLYAFNKKTLLFTLEMAGYKVVNTSGFVRCLPFWMNFLLDPLLQHFGANLWVLAEKTSVKTNFNKVFLPGWFTK